jgi:hypothetical protein
MQRYDFFPNRQRFSGKNSRKYKKYRTVLIYVKERKGIHLLYIYAHVIYLRAREESNTVIIDVVDNAVVGLIMMSLLP